MPREIFTFRKKIILTFSYILLIVALVLSSNYLNLNETSQRYLVKALKIPENFIENISQEFKEYESLKIVDLENEIIKLKNDISSPKKISGNYVKSPIIGTAYLAPEPGGKKFTEVGKKIKKGDTVMIVEAMKTMNHVPSPFDGVVKEICVEDGSPVEFDQIIAIVS